ncbi:MAG: DUF222 domain-containing protein [Terrimesophilobacter sp.]
MTNLATALLESANAVTGFGVRGEDFDHLTDDQIIALNQAIAECERRLGSYKTHAAGQLARRSTRELGHGGLAARHGFSSPEKMLQDVTKSSGREAVQVVALGRLLDEADATRRLLGSGTTDIGGEPIAVPWQAPIATAIAEGTLSIACGDALRRGLGSPTESVHPETLREIAETLIAQQREADSAGLSADQMFTAARLQRDLIDLEGVKARQQEMYDRGGVKLFPKPDGMWQLTGQLDPESAAILTTALDPYTSPRRGGPRFVNPNDKARAQAIIDDPRSTERLTLDGLLELVTLGAALDPQKMHPKMRTLVKIVTVVDDSLLVETGRENASSAGHVIGLLEASGDMIAGATVERSLCDGDTVAMEVTRTGDPLNLGRTTRLFSQRQREALAARDGGCLWPGCERPPAFTEAHHTRQWKRDRGKTDIVDGCLLCRFHHRQLHNNGWEIQRDSSGTQAAGFTLTPPRTIEPNQTPIMLESKSALFRQLQARGTG